MSDQEWKARVAAIEDPAELLRELVQLDDDVAGVGDPYYRDLYDAIIERARTLRGEQPEPHSHYDPAHYSADGDPAGYGDPPKDCICSAPDGDPANVTICEKHWPLEHVRVDDPSAEVDLSELPSWHESVIKAMDSDDDWARGEAANDWGSS